MTTQPVDLAQIGRQISRERLQPYLALSAHDIARALALYRWNAAMASAFWIDLAHAEVILRNAMDVQLTTWTAQRTDEHWYNVLGAVFTPQSLEDIAKAKRRVRAEGMPLIHGRVLAAISFGFWRFLLSGRYDRTLWRPCLYRAFPHCRTPRRVVHETLHRLHNLRNRIAHHEPVHNRDLKALYDDLLTTVGWISPSARTWVEAGSSVPKTLAQRPGVPNGC